MVTPTEDILESLDAAGVRDAFEDLTLAAKREFLLWILSARSKEAGELRLQSVIEALH